MTKKEVARAAWFAAHAPRDRATTIAEGFEEFWERHDRLVQVGAPEDREAYEATLRQLAEATWRHHEAIGKNEDEDVIAALVTMHKREDRALAERDTARDDLSNTEIAVEWARRRLVDCGTTLNTSRHAEPRNRAEGEAVAYNLMLKIIAGDKDALRAVAEDNLRRNLRTAPRRTR